MGLFVKLRNYRERKAYEHAVKVREKYAPYGVMYGKIVAYQRTQPGSRSNNHAKPPDPHDDMKHDAKVAFMTHPGATNEDFERCWPAIRDEIFKNHALRKLNKLATPEERRNKPYPVAK